MKGKFGTKQAAVLSLCLGARVCVCLLPSNANPGVWFCAFEKSEESGLAVLRKSKCKNIRLKDSLILFFVYFIFCSQSGMIAKFFTRVVQLSL